uniref:Conserved plasma membrane protein n=1 Tax=Schistocephalus solidus TaxID=70667 RepID=A0A183SBC8_SCHSO
LGFLSALSHPKYKLPDGSRLQPHSPGSLQSVSVQAPTRLTESLACTIENAANTTFLDRWGVVRNINGPFWPLRHGPLMPGPRIRGYKLRDSGKPDVSSFSLARQQQVLSRLMEVRKDSSTEANTTPPGSFPQPSKPLLVFDTELSAPLDQRLKQWQQRTSFPNSDASGHSSGTPFLLFESRILLRMLLVAVAMAVPVLFTTLKGCSTKFHLHTGFSGPYEYELILNTDLWTKRHTQWYFFMVCGAQTGVVYTFKILNLLKPTSLYSQGKPSVFHE